MTRINIGISVTELCDQHLLAEYRELPRMIAFANKRVKNGDMGRRPESFTLGTGHMSFFIPFGKTLQYRWTALWAEMVWRGFKPTLNCDWESYPFQGYLPLIEIESARPLVIERIRSRLSTAKRTPTWTGRRRPDWAFNTVCEDAPPASHLHPA